MCVCVDVDVDVHVAQLASGVCVWRWGLSVACCMYECVMLYVCMVICVLTCVPMYACMY